MPTSVHATVPPIPEMKPNPIISYLSLSDIFSITTF